MSGLIENQESVRLPEWATKPFVINLDSEDDDSDSEDSYSLPGRSKGITNLSSSSSTAISSDSQSSLSSLSSTSLRIASLEQNVEASGGFDSLPGRSKGITNLSSSSNTAIASDSQSSLSSLSSTSLRIASWEQNVKAWNANATADVKQPKVNKQPEILIDLTGNTPTLDQSCTNSKALTPASVSPTTLYTSSTISNSSSIEQTFRHILPQSDTTFRACNYNNDFHSSMNVGATPSNGLTTSMISDIGNAAYYNHTQSPFYSQFGTYNRCQTGMHCSPVNQYDTLVNTVHGYGRTNTDNISMATDSGLYRLNTSFNMFGINNNSRACEEETMDIDDDFSMYTHYTAPSHYNPVPLIDLNEPMEVDECVYPFFTSKKTRP